MLIAAGAAIKEDGVWGRNTELAYLRANEQVRLSIDESVLRWEKVRVSDIRASAAKRRPAGDQTGAFIGYRRDRSAGGGFSSVPQNQAKLGVIDKSTAEGLARRAEGIFSLPAGTLTQMLELEARAIRQGGRVIAYDAAAKGGSGGRYLGLYQFFDREVDGAGNPYAWGVARAYARKLGIQLPPLAEGWSNPNANTTAAAAYAAYHADQYRRRGVKPTPGLLYAAHQQGLGTALRMVATGNVALAGVQSSQSVKVISDAIRRG